MAQGGERRTPGRPVNRASAEPEVVFRIVHVVLDDGCPPPDGSPSSSYREQAVEIALGPNPIFQTGHFTAVRRRVPPDQVVNAVPPSRRRAQRCRPRERAGPPRIVETLCKAIEWRRQLDAGEVPNQAAIARREGLTRARVTQIMGLLRLAPEIQECILCLKTHPNPQKVAEHMLRRIARLEDPQHQVKTFEAVL